VPLELTIGRGDKGPEYFISKDRMFQPGEVRENDVVRPSRRQSADRVARPSRTPLAAEVETACRNVRRESRHPRIRRSEQSTGGSDLGASRRVNRMIREGQ
jgi:hypothetical protein